MRLIHIVLLAVAVLAAHPAAAQRVRDLGSFEGVRPNQLTGYGIVVGLQGTGDDNLDYLTHAAKGVAGRLGMTLPPGVAPGLKNAAAVILTAELPAFAKPGQRIDITVSTMGKAKSLRGGTLVLTALVGADGQVYAMAQGSVAVGGLGVSSRDGSQLSVNVPTVGRIAAGATVERSVPSDFADGATVRYNLHDADFLTASRVRDVVNARFPGIARIVDGVTVELTMPTGSDDRSTLLANVEMLEIAAAQVPARVIINSRTGTVVMNGAVRLSPAAVSHGKLIVRIAEDPAVVQPRPLSGGVTAREEASSIDVTERGERLTVIEGGANLSQIVDALNTLGVGAADLVAILEGLKQAGALQAELVVI